MIIKMFHKTKRKKEKKKLFQIFICSIHKIVLIKKKKKLRQKNAQVVLLFVLSFDSVFP